MAHDSVIPLDLVAYPRTTRASAVRLTSASSTSHPNCRVRGSPLGWVVPSPSTTSDTMTTGASLASNVTSYSIAARCRCSSETRRRDRMETR